MTATLPRTVWWDATGEVVHLAPRVEGGKHLAADDAALVSIIGGPADGRAWVTLRGRKVPMIVGIRLRGQYVAGRPVIAWHRRDDGPPRLTYRFMHTSAGWPAMGATAA